MKKQLLFAACVLGCTSLGAQGGMDKVYVDVGTRGHDISKNMYGIFFEEINHAGDGGLYAELIQNRGFEEHVLPSGHTYRDGRAYAPHELCYWTDGYNDAWIEWDFDKKKMLAWSVESEGCTVDYDVKEMEVPLHANTPHAFSMNISGSAAGAKAVLVNSGYWGIAVKDGAAYDLRFYLRSSDYKGSVKAVIYNKEKNSVVASRGFTVNGDGEWNEYTAVLEATETLNNADFRLEFSGDGTVDVDYVSLFPQDTYKGRKNGLRRDLAEFVTDMKPKFMRWPGGCIVEGMTLENRVKWKETLGDPMTRRGEYVLWGYRSTWGMGYHEFLQFCEDAGMDAMFVGNAGLSCCLRNGDYTTTEEEWEVFYQDIRDAIEYAIGDPVTNEWAKKRAEAGHPEPFPLKYVEIGNENGTMKYVLPFNYIYGKLKREYPDLTFINTLTWWDGDLNSVTKTDMIDPHWYVAPEYFYNQTSLFDDVERGKFTVYVGEYACNNEVGKGNLEAAFSESSFIMAMERNSDLVTMASYAPLISNDNQPNWACNLIWQKNDRVVGRASYYIQKMFSENRPDYNIASQLYSDRLSLPCEGRIGLGSWLTNAEFRNVKVTSVDGERTFYESDFTDRQGEWTPIAGAWSFADGRYAQTDDTQVGCMSLMNTLSFRDCCFEVEACKKSGAEGFLITFGMNPDDESHNYRMNIGGWGNSGIALEEVTDGNGAVVSDKVPFKVENDRWYKIRIVTENGTSMKCFIDGELVLTHDFPAYIPGRIQSISGYDKENGEIVIKVLNAESTPWSANFRLNARNIQKAGTVTVLSSGSLYDENSFEQPTLIYPETTDFNGFGETFDYTFKPYSFTILRVKADEAAEAMEIPGFTYSDEPQELENAPTDELGMACRNLRKLVERASESCINNAVGYESLQTAIRNAEETLGLSDLTVEAVNERYDNLSASLKTYFKAQMVAENEQTGKIQSPSFTENVSTGWNGTAPTLNFDLAEFFSTRFNMYQTVEGLDNGYYLVYMQGYYRFGLHEFAQPAHDAGTEELNVTFSANNASAPVVSIYEHQFEFGWNGYCNFMGDAKEAFSRSDDNFANYLMAQVTDGTLKIIVGKDKFTDADWFCFDNFRLFRIPGMPTTAVTAVVKDETAGTALYDIAGRKVGEDKLRKGLRPGIYIRNGKKIIIK